MSAITAALSQIDGVAAEGDLVPDPAAPLELETAGEPILLPDGKRIYPPCLHGQPVDELAVALLDMDDPAQSTFLRLIGPPGAGKSQIARAIAYRLWTGRGREVADRHGAPFYGFVELQPGPSSDEFFFRYDYVPVAGAGGQVKLVDSAFVQAMREGWVVMIDEVNTARDVALLSINATLDGRLTPVPGGDRRDRRRPARVRRPARLQPGARRRDRHPRRVALAVPRDARGHEQLGGARAARRAAGARGRGDAARPRSGSPARTGCAGRRSSATSSRCGGCPSGSATAPRSRSSPPTCTSRCTAGKIQDAEAAAACRMLDQAGYGRYRVAATSRVPNLHGYPRAVTS